MSIRLTRDVGILQTQVADLHVAMRAIELRLVALEEAATATAILDDAEYEIADQGNPMRAKRGPGRPRKEPVDAA